MARFTARRGVGGGCVSKWIIVNARTDNSSILEAESLDLPDGTKFHDALKGALKHLGVRVVRLDEGMVDEVAVEKATRQYKCGSCGHNGHNIRTCVSEIPKSPVEKNQRTLDENYILPAPKCRHPKTGRWTGQHASCQCLNCKADLRDAKGLFKKQYFGEEGGA